jgi:GT2 family glycosyltransferase
MSVSFTPVVTIVIVNWNGCAMLDACLASVYMQDFQGYEVVVVDNGSKDQSVAMIHDKYPQVRVICLDKNTGFCYANNIGISESSAPFIVLLNNDTEVKQSWLSTLYEYMVSHPDVAACDSKVLYADRPDVIWSAGFVYSTAGAAHPRGYQEVDDDRWKQNTEVFGVVACSAMYRRSVLQQIGVLDEDFFAGYEDVDWSFRARLAGYRLVNVPASEVYHKVSMTQKHNSESFVYRGQRNVEIVYIKNMPLALLMRYIIVHFLYILGSGIYFIMIGRGKAFWRGKIAAVQTLPRTLDKRKKNIQLWKVGSGEILEWMDSRWWQKKIRKFKSSLRSHTKELESHK